MNPRESDRSREARLRRTAARRGYKLVKGRRRDPLAIDYGHYWLLPIDPRVVNGERELDSLDEVEAFLAAPR